MTRLVAIALSLIAMASGDDIGGLAGGFLRMGVSARSVAMGGGFTAEVDGAFAAFHNPAALARQNDRRVSFLQHLLPLDRYLISAAFSSPLPPTATVGLAFLGAGAEDITGRDHAGFPTGTFSTAEYAGYLSFANRLTDRLSVGVNVKMVYHRLSLDEPLSSQGAGIDGGMFYAPSRRLSLGLVAQDPSTRYNWNTSEYRGAEGSSYQDNFPAQYRAGVAIHPDHFDLAVDYAFLSSRNGVTAHRVRGGAEYRPWEKVAIRAGVDGVVPSIGAGLRYRLLRPDDAQFDYAVRIGSGGEGLAHIFTYVLAF